MRKIHEKLIRAKPIKVENILISLPTLNEIFDLGLDKYLEYLQSIIIDISDLNLDTEIFAGEEFSDYQIFIMLLLTSKDFQNTFFEAMQLFTNDTFVFEQEHIVGLRKTVTEEGEVSFEFNQILTEEFWLEMRKVLSLAHMQEEPKRYDYANAKAKAIMEKLRKNKEEVQRIKAKRGQSESLEVYELIGSVCTHSKAYNLFNVWNLTYYQFFDHYYRLNINDNYHFSLQSILAGADPKKVKVEHWTSSIKTN